MKGATKLTRKIFILSLLSLAGNALICIGLSFYFANLFRSYILYLVAIGVIISTLSNLAIELLLSKYFQKFSRYKRKIILKR